MDLGDGRTPPDGPNMATISPGSTVSDTRSAGRIGPNVLLMDLISSRAIMLALKRAERQALDQISLRIEREQQGRRHRQHNRRSNLPILNTGGGDESECTHGYRLLVGRGQDQGENEIVPAEDERQERRGRNAGARE